VRHERNHRLIRQRLVGATINPDSKIRKTLGDALRGASGNAANRREKRKMVPFPSSKSEIPRESVW
jgi:hypothetical protein